jgi:2-polyprenyl-6-methoxyphenol hydroxylase-like FAD-dependent oxidoreductase
MRVLIIGGGVGGLCLAQGLRKANIGVTVYERQSSAMENLAGYGIHLDHHGLAALEACLPPTNMERLQAAAGRAGTCLAFRDPSLSLLAARDEAVVSGRPAAEVERRGIGRLELRDILLDGLTDPQDPVVQWGKTFTDYDTLPDGRVIARFSDGSEAIGDVLVGADASHSQVRAQYLPHIHRTDLGVLTVAGRYILDEARAAALPRPLTDGSLNNIVPAGPGWMFVSAWRSRPADLGPIRQAAEHYVVWAYVAARSAYPAQADDLDAAGLRDFVLTRIKGWSDDLQTLVRDCDLETVAKVPLRSMPPLEPWPPSTVTLLGDAIHNMTPMAGVGANTALRDADELRQALVDAAAGRQEVTSAIGAYEARMRVYANAAVGLSRRNAQSAASERPLPRLMFRLILRLAHRFAPIMRATIGRAATAK